MGTYTAVADELSVKDESSRSLREKSFESDDLDSLSFEEAQPGLEICVEYSIEHSLEESNLKRMKELSGSRFSIRNIPRRRRIVIGLAILFGIILIVAVSVTASRGKKSQQSSASSKNTLEDNYMRSRLHTDNDMSSRLDSAEDRFQSAGRGEGGGSGNVQFVEAQNDNVFLGDNVRIPPFSVLDPVLDLDRYEYKRPESSSPSGRLDPLIGKKNRALPTNAWYQNMLRLEMDEDPTKDHRIYTIPYVIDAAGDFAGIRAHATRIVTTPIQVELAIDDPYGLTLGAMSDVNSGFAATVLDKGYSVQELTDLGLTLQWNSYMKTTLVRGSPYVTMIYDMSDLAVSEGVLPTMHWSLDTSEFPIVDGSKAVDCLSEPVFTVERDLELVFYNSKQRWIVFFSRPVQLQCQNNPGRPTIFQVLKGEINDEDPFLIIRGALIVSSSSVADDDEAFVRAYANQLRASADVYPGQSITVAHSFNEQSDIARISFDWDAQSMHASNRNSITEMLSRSGNKLIMFALPHHRDILDGKVSPTLCTTSIMGPVCLVEGNIWNMYENLPDVNFRAARHPDPKYIPILAEALTDDIRYEIPSNFRSGAADTYFSGKTIAKLARILLVTEEVKDLCALASPNESYSEYVAACDELELPSDEEIEEALNQLRDSVTVWVRTNAKAPFVYDNAWGGLVNCGCLYNDGECTNVFPECPAFTDQGLNFGNAFYNDHHFHYGYHIYAAAALAHFDSSWAVELYEDVTLLVRDYANPSQEDSAFPVFRNKDWYRGHSWAGGLTKPMFRNGKNQESASEAIMAYEAVALFGKTMSSIFQNTGDTDKASVAEMMHKIGLTLTATEIRSTQKYWQVRQNVQDSERIYPEGYTANVVGILWETFAQFTTWFGNAPYLIYGIQLLPLTPISEARDGLEWANEIYGPLSESCNGLCVSEGWSIQVNAILATIGRVQEAIEGVRSIPSTAYLHAGGNGHSKSNTLWYISTRFSGSSPSSQSEEEFDTISTDEEESETIDIDEEDSNYTTGDDQQSEITGGDEFLFDFDEVDILEDIIVEDEFADENSDSESNDNNIFDEIMAGNEGSNDKNFNDDNIKVSGNMIKDNVESDVYEDLDEDFTGNDDFDDNDNDIDDDGDDETIDVELTCFNPMECTDEVLDIDADGYSCRERIQYLMDVLGKPEFDACQQVAVDEYATQCGFCRPRP